MAQVYALGIAVMLFLFMEAASRWKGGRRALARKAAK
jgi:hypothetical protein